jgi:hypothetical protein
MRILRQVNLFAQIALREFAQPSLDLPLLLVLQDRRCPAPGIDPRPTYRYVGEVTAQSCCHHGPESCTQQHRCARCACWVYAKMVVMACAVLHPYAVYAGAGSCVTPRQGRCCCCCCQDHNVLTCCEGP